MGSKFDSELLTKLKVKSTSFPFERKRDENWMAVASSPLLINRFYLRRVSEPYSRVNKRRPWLPPTDATLFDSRRNLNSQLLVFASSSSPSTDDLTAEWCVNSGLDLFKRGRVSCIVRFEWYCEYVSVCFLGFLLASSIWLFLFCMILWNG